MDSSDVSSERFENFADADYDPDLEARLYAEIYYSNETYTEDSRAADLPITDPGDPPNTASPNAHCDPPGTNITQASSISDQSVTPVVEKSNVYVWTSGTPGVNQSTDRCYAERVFPKRCRLLARENLWTGGNDSNTLPIHRQNFQKDIHNELPKAANVGETINPIDNPRNQEVQTSERERSKPNEPLPPKRKETKSKKKKKHSIPTQPFRGTWRLRRKHNAVLIESDLTSKYKVVSKRTKLNMEKASSEAAVVSSDSDDSILEVPVPPKAKPVVIQLVDSEDEGTSSDSSENDEESRQTESRDETTREHDNSGSNTILDESANAPSAADDGTVGFGGDDIILNCTEPPPGPSNVEKTAAPRTGGPSCMYSDDSMTESEANNWSNIAAGETNPTTSQERSPADKSMDQSFGLLWDQLSLDNSTGPQPVTDTTDIILNTTGAENSLNDSTEEQTERNKRKRPKNAKSLDNSGVSEIPEKRSKGNESETSTNQSLVDYFFTPMSKELQTFYTAPSSSGHLDVNDMQKKMPRNPKYWPILEADLRPPTKRRGKVCAYCKDNAHFGKKCPEKPSQPICLMCGEKGHVEIRCPKTMCLTCGHSYTSYRQTCSLCTKLTCTMCNGVGHSRDNCPDLWRRYHNVTTETQPRPHDLRKTMKSSQNLSCCNCAKRGHDATMCKQLRWSLHFPTPAYVTSYTDGPNYPGLRQERIEDSNLDCQTNEADKTEVSSRSLASSNRVSTKGLIFEIRVANMPNSCARLSARLDTLPGVYLEGLLSGTLKFPFLRKLATIYRFTLNITHNADNSISSEICSKTNEVVSGVNKLLMQWLSRTDEQKSYLKYNQIGLPFSKSLKGNLKKKLLQLEDTTEPLELLQSADLYKREVAELEKQSRNVSTIPNYPAAKYKQLRKKICSAVRNLRLVLGKFNAVVHIRDLIKNGSSVTCNFRTAAHKVSNSSNKNHSVSNYINVIYYNNELFTYHDSDAMREVIAKIRASAPPIPSLLALPTNTPCQLKESDSEIQPVDPPCENGVDYDSPAATEPAASVASSEQLPTSNSVDPMEQNDQSITNCPDKPDQPNLPHNLLYNHYRKLEPNKPKQRLKNGALSHLPKKERKLYRRTAREAIKLANATSLAWLRTFAQTISAKMKDGSIRKSDVKELQDAITTALGKRKTARTYAGQRKTARKKRDPQLARSAVLRNL